MSDEKATPMGIMTRVSPMAARADMEHRNAIMNAAATDALAAQGD